MTSNPYIRYDLPKEGANDSTPPSESQLHILYQQVEKNSENTARINRRVSKKLKDFASR